MFPLTSSLSNRSPVRAGARSLGFAVALAALLAGAPSARADQFSVVPAGSPVYSQLTSLNRAGWLDDLPASAAQASGQRDKTLTRYEISLQVARAIFSIAARQESDSTWAASISKTDARALYDLTNEFRAELIDLGVDVAASQKRMEPLWRGKMQLPTGRPAGASSPAVKPVSAVPGRPSASRDRSAVLSRDFRTPFSRNSFSALTRDADGLFGDAARDGVAPGGARSAFGSQTFGTDSSIPRAGVAVGVTDWLALRADYARQQMTRPAAIPLLAARTAAFGSSRELSSLRGGIDLSLWRSLKLSGDIENITGDGVGNPSWTRLGGGIGWSAMRNRLSLKANMSRLVPDDIHILPSTLVGLNLGLDVSDRMTLNLLYQEMFSAPASADPNRLVAGGVSLNF